MWAVRYGTEEENLAFWMTEIAATQDDFSGVWNFGYNGIVVPYRVQTEFFRQLIAPFNGEGYERQDGLYYVDCDNALNVMRDVYLLVDDVWLQIPASDYVMSIVYDNGEVSDQCYLAFETYRDQQS